MDHQTGDTGAQFVLDNRKLIVGFALLIVVCGTFFVIGFMEGKRQGILRAKEQLPRSPASEPIAAAQGGEIPDRAHSVASKAVDERSVREQLDWYKSVNKREEAAPATKAQARPPAPAPAEKAAARRGAESTASPSVPAKKPEVSRQSRAGSPPKVTYTVQVGAFRLRREAETIATTLKEKNYEYSIEPSGGAEPLFLLKVGRFESRAEAVAMQLKLKKDGFATFIKTTQ